MGNRRRLEMGYFLLLLFMLLGVFYLSPYELLIEEEED